MALSQSTRSSRTHLTGDQKRMTKASEYGPVITLLKEAQTFCRLKNSEKNRAQYQQHKRAEDACVTKALKALKDLQASNVDPR